MAHESVRWLIEGKVILERFYGTMTIEDIEKTQPDVLALRDAGTVDHVHILVDGQGVTKLDINPVAMLQVESLKAVMKHPKAGMGIYITANNPIHNFFLRLLSKIGSRTKICYSTEDALEVLGQLVDLPGDVHDRLKS